MICDRFDQSENGVKIALEAATVIKSSAFDISSYFVNGEMKRSVIYKVNWWKQFTAVLWRSWLGVTKEPLIIKVRMLQNL
ncbi:protein white-like, partial [Agrilus planipennis]